MPAGRLPRYGSNLVSTIRVYCFHFPAPPCDLTGFCCLSPLSLIGLIRSGPRHRTRQPAQPRLSGHLDWQNGSAYIIRLRCPSLRVSRRPGQAVLLQRLRHQAGGGSRRRPHRCPAFCSPDLPPTPSRRRSFAPTEALLCLSLVSCSGCCDWQGRFLLGFGPPALAALYFQWRDNHRLPVSRPLSI